MYQIALLSSVADLAIEVAKSSLEWMTEGAPNPTAAAPPPPLSSAFPSISSPEVAPITPPAPSPNPPAAIAEDFQRTRENPFHLGRRVRLCRGTDDLERLGPGPKVILASLASLEGGAARELLLQLSKEEASTVLLTDRAAARGEVGEWLLQYAGSPQHRRPSMPITLAKHVPLRGAKLEGARGPRERAGLFVLRFVVPRMWFVLSVQRETSARWALK